MDVLLCQQDNQTSITLVFIRFSTTRATVASVALGNSTIIHMKPCTKRYSLITDTLTGIETRGGTLGPRPPSLSCQSSSVRKGPSHIWKCSSNACPRKSSEPRATESFWPFRVGQTKSRQRQFGASVTGHWCNKSWYFETISGEIKAILDENHFL